MKTFALVLIGALVAVTVIGEIGRVVVVADIVNHLRLLILLVGAFALAIALLAKAGLWPALALAAAMVWQMNWVLPEYIQSASRGPGGGAILTIATYNTHGIQSDAEAIGAWVRREGIDVLVLQEVGREAHDMVETLSAVLPHYVARRWQSNVVMSRFPMVERQRNDLPVGDRRWYFPIVRIAPPGRAPISVMSVHTTRPPPMFAGQSEQLAWVSAAAEQIGRARLIVAGDFNLTPFSTRFQPFVQDLAMHRATLALPSFPTWSLRTPFAVLPFLPIDHVFHGDGFVALSAALGPDLGSDHYPVIVRLRER
jgi:endonuclease/exonuclease/phosphatase (EEP) superfamily protein YafD